MIDAFEICSRKFQLAYYSSLLSLVGPSNIRCSHWCLHSFFRRTENMWNSIRHPFLPTTGRSVPSSRSPRNNAYPSSSDNCAISRVLSVSVPRNFFFFFFSYTRRNLATIVHRFCASVPFDYASCAFDFAFTIVHAPGNAAPSATIGISCRPRVLREMTRT